MPGVAQLLTTSESNEWYTPPSFVQRVCRVLGVIDLDPASSATSQQWILAARYFTVEDDGLAEENSWYGNVFLNPPYGRGVKKWVDKLLYEFGTCKIEQAILLVKAATDTRWFGPLFDYLICFITGRMHFLKPVVRVGKVGLVTGPATFPSAVVYLGENTKGFAEAFSEIGNVLINYNWR